MNSNLCHPKVGVVVFAHTPPPHHGQSFMVALLVDGFKDGHASRDLRMYHVNARLSMRLEDVGSFRLGKIAHLFIYFVQALWLRVRHGADVFYYIPGPAKKLTIWRDWIVLVAARLFFKKIVLHWHAGGLGEWVAKEPENLRKLVTKRVFKRLDLFISLTKSTRKLRDIFQPKNSIVIANGIPDLCPEFARDVLPERLERLRCRENAVKASPASGGIVFFQTIFMALCSEEKGLFAALDAVTEANAMLTWQNSTIRITLTVTGKFLTRLERKRFEERIKQPDLQIQDGALTVSAVSYHGFVGGEAKERLLVDSDCLLFPSRYPIEEQPVAVIEALAHGLPTLVSDWRGLSELMAGTNLPAPSQTSRELVKNILSVLYYGEFSRLREKYLIHHTVPVMLEKIRRAIISVADNECPAATVSAPPKNTKPLLLGFEFYQLGDGVLSLPFLRGALERYRVVMYCSAPVAKLYSICLPEVKTLVCRRDGDTGGVRVVECIRQLRVLRPAVAVSILPDPRIQFLMMCSGAAERVGFRTDDQNIWSPSYLRWRRAKVLAARAAARFMQHVTGSEWLTRVLDRGKPTRAQWKSWRQLADTLSVPWRDEFPWFAADGEPPLTVKKFLAGARAAGREVFLVHTGARNASRRWPRERFAAVIDDYLLPKGAAVLVTDSGEGNLPAVESPWCQVWQSRGLAEFFAVLSRVDTVLCNDSFPAHAAAALGKRVYTIFSAQEAEWFAPYGNEHRVIQKDVCQYRPCLDYCKQPSYLCLEAVTPADVIKKLAADDDHRAAEI